MAGFCRRFRLLLFRRREMNLILLYNVLILVALSVLVVPPDNIPQYVISIITGVGVCVCPIAGCLADIYCSRYKFIKISMKLTWVGVLIQSAASVVFYAKGICVDNDSSLICKGVVVILHVLPTFGLAGFLPNIIQFSIDQLQEASTTEITSFIVWYIWTWNLGILLGVFSQSCFCGTQKLVAALLLPISISLALCLDSFFSHWLVREPVRYQNPFKLFFGVLHYAAKNRYPRQRSAFTYWEDKPYSRIDLAKDKYGGPFTTEQVEDVKIVLRIFTLQAVTSVSVGLFYNLGVSYDVKVIHHLKGLDDTHSSQYCNSEDMLFRFQSLALKYSLHFVIFCFIPIHEFVIYPIFWKYMILMTSASKFFIGLFSLTLCCISLLTIEAVGYHYTDFSDGNLTCFLSERSLPLSLNVNWYLIPGLLRGISSLYIYWGAIEYICSQSPYTMKGLLFGSIYFHFGLSVLFTSLLLLPVSLTVEKWHPVLYGCGVWFYLCATLFFLIFTLLCIVVFKKVHKMRRRDEDLHNRHIFAINYYSHYIQYNKEMQTE